MGGGSSFGYTDDGYAEAKAERESIRKERDKAARKKRIAAREAAKSAKPKKVERVKL